MASRASTRRADVSWEGDSRDVLRSWPKDIRSDFGIALDALQQGGLPALAIRPMQSIAAGVFELKDADESKWYRLVYLARIEDTIYVLHCFTKNTAKTERRDIEKAKQRWKQVQQKIRGGRNEQKKG
jgi:phage-related protein